MSASDSLLLAGSIEVCIEQSSRSKRLRLSVSPSGVRVAVPRGLKLEQGRVFALQNEAWIIRQVKRLQQSTAAQSPPEQALDLSQARRAIITRLQELSARHNLPYGKVSLRRQKTRWGSCTSRGDINLNLALALLPTELMDYVILHELVHTRIKGHGPDFWQALAGLAPDTRHLRARLKHYHPAILLQNTPWG